MNEINEMWREHKQHWREVKEKHGIDCPGCLQKQPKRIPSRLLPGWTCKVCGYHRPKGVQ
jgi:ribosomal protein L37AE/L43A